MTNFFDVMIIGLGANGSAAAYHLSKKGIRVGGVDRFHPPHEHGSSHGQSRIIRQGYFESPLYVPFLKEAYRIWGEVEQATGRDLFLKTGGLMLGAANSELIIGSRLSAAAHGIPYEFLTNNEIKARFPAFKCSSAAVGVLEKNAGILFPEACISAFLGEAERSGAILKYNEKVLRIVPGERTAEIITDKNRYTAEKLIISAGAWMKELVPGLTLPLTVERQALHWFRNTNKELQPFVLPDRLPVFIYEYAPGKRFYGFPDLGDGIKIAYHHAGEIINPEELKNDVSPAEIDDMRLLIQKYFNITPEYNYSATCMYTNTPDEHFIIDLHPAHKNICIASPCSGHGFKFSSLTGKLIGDLVLGNEIPFNLSPFSISRVRFPE